MTVKVGINGFGRVGRQSLKALLEKYPKLDVVAINDITDAETNAHLFKYDSSYGKFNGSVEVKDGNLVVNGKTIKVFMEKDPANLPWSSVGAQIILESTGLFTSADKAKVHITNGGAKKVIISAPGKGEDITIVLGVNEKMYDPAKHHIISNASCTTNCFVPVAKVLHDRFGIVRAMMTTIHAYTNDQRILDLPHKDKRRARAAGLSIIPTTTGAAKAAASAIPALKGKFSGFALRVPTPTVSVVDLSVVVEKPTTKDEVNAAMKEYADGEMKGILGFSTEPLVSVDFKGDERSSIVDAELTDVLDGTLVKVVTWYDNEWGYSCRIADLINYIAQKGL